MDEELSDLHRRFAADNRAFLEHTSAQVEQWRAEERAEREEHRRLQAWRAKVDKDIASVVTGATKVDHHFQNQREARRDAPPPQVEKGRDMATDDVTWVSTPDLEIVLDSLCAQIRKYVDQRVEGAPPTRADADVIVELRSEIRQLQRELIHLRADHDQVSAAHREHLANLETKFSKLRRGEE